MELCWALWNWLFPAPHPISIKEAWNCVSHFYYWLGAGGWDSAGINYWLGIVGRAGLNLSLALGDETVLVRPSIIDRALGDWLLAWALGDWLFPAGAGAGHNWVFTERWGQDGRNRAGQTQFLYWATSLYNPRRMLLVTYLPKPNTPASPYNPEHLTRQSRTDGPYSDT